MNQEDDLTEKESSHAAATNDNEELKRGLINLEGPIRERDERAAFLHFLRAADKGSPEAHARLAAMYFEGTGTVSSPGQALHHALQAAISGNPEAQFLLGCLYLRGDGCDADDNQAIQWIRKAADQRWPEAEFQLGLFYARGNYSGHWSLYGRARLRRAVTFSREIELRLDGVSPYRSGCCPPDHLKPCGLNSYCQRNSRDSRLEHGRHII